MVGMLRRMVLALLTLCLALPTLSPVAAMSLERASLAMEHHGHQQPDSNRHHDQGQQTGKHECIGCAAPVGGGTVAAETPLPRSLVARPPLAARLTDTRNGPDTPPPRM